MTIVLLAHAVKKCAHGEKLVCILLFQIKSNMNEGVAGEYSGATVTAEYAVIGDTLSVYSHNGI